MLAEIELDGNTTIEFGEVPNDFTYFIVKIEHESKDRLWFWPMEKGWSFIYRPCCIISILTQNTSFGAKPHFSNFLLTQSVLCAHMFVYICTHMYGYTHTSICTNIVCNLCIHTHMYIHRQSDSN